VSERALLAFSGGDDVAREKAAERYADDIQKVQQIAERLEAAGFKYGPHLYRAIAAEYAFREPLSGSSFATAGWVVQPSGCSAIDSRLRDRAGAPRAEVRIVVTECESRVAGAEEVRVEVKHYKVLSISGAGAARKDDGHYQTTNTMDRSGETLVSSTTTYVGGQSTGGGGGGVRSFVDAEGSVPVHHTTLRSAVKATVYLKTAEGTSEIAISAEDKIARADWQFLDVRDGMGLSGHTEDVVSREIDDQLNALPEQITNRIIAMRTASLLDIAKTSDNPERALDAMVGVAYLSTNDEALSWIVEHVSAPREIILAALGRTKAVEVESSLAYTLDAPPSLSSEEQEEIRGRYDLIAARTFEHGGGARTEWAAGMQTSEPTGTMVSDPASSYGGGIAYKASLEIDPGRTENGAIFGLAWDSRLGYAGGTFFDMAVPLWLGARIGPFGLSGSVMLGWNRFGRDAESDLWVRNAPYAGYGLQASFVSLGSFDVAGSYTKTSRAKGWQHEDVTSDEKRYELRLMHYGSEKAHSLTLRYAKFLGEPKGGQALTLWLGLVSFGE
jgi:hypothetical protein